MDFTAMTAQSRTPNWAYFSMQLKNDPYFTSYILNNKVEFNRKSVCRNFELRHIVRVFADVCCCKRELLF